MYIADEKKKGRSKAAYDFQEKVADDQHGRPCTDIVHMQIIAMGKASNLAHNFRSSFHSESCSQLAGERVACLRGLLKVDFAQHILIGHDVCEEMVIATVQHCLRALVICAVRNHLAEVMVPLWCPARNVEAMLPDLVNYMSMQVFLGDRFV